MNLPHRARLWEKEGLAGESTSSRERPKLHFCGGAEEGGPCGPVAFSGACLRAAVFRETRKRAVVEHAEATRYFTEATQGQNAGKWGGNKPEGNITIEARC